jgi:heat shock transcription factor
MARGYDTTEPTPDDEIQIIDRDDGNNITPDKFDFVDGVSGTDSLHAFAGKPEARPKYDDNLFDDDNLRFIEDNNHNMDSSGLTPLLLPVSEYLGNNQLILNHTNSNGSLPNNSVPNLKYNIPTVSPLTEAAAMPNLHPYPISMNPEPRKLGSGTAPTTKRRRENNTPKTRPAFVMKVWSMVNDEKNHQYIRWNSDGKTFQVFHREEFMKEILPKYFKHNNFASFVRQLNMYGWHKVQDITSGTLNDDKNQEEIWQFKNPNFIRGHEELLDKIVRNKTIQEDEQSTNANTLQLILSELNQIKMNQIAVNEDLKRIRKDNKTLWQENYITRERHQQQAQTLDKILKFLATVYGNKQQFIDEQHDNPYATTDYSTSPFTKPRLMLMDQEFKSPGEPSTKPNIRSQSSQSQSQSQPPQQPQSQATLHRPSSSSSIEEIMRSYGNTPKDMSTQDVGRMFQQMINNGNYDNQYNRNNNKNYGSSSRYSMSRGINPQNGTSGVNSNLQSNIGSSSGTTSANGVLPPHLGQEVAQSPRHYFPELNVAPTTNSGQQYLRIGSPSPDIYSNNEVLNGIEQNVAKQGHSVQQVQDWIQKLAQQQKNHGNQQTTSNPPPTAYTPSSNLDEFDVNDFLSNDNHSIISDQDKKRPVEENYEPNRQFKKHRNA